MTRERSLYFLVKTLLPSGSFRFNLSLFNSDFVLKLGRGPGLEQRRGCVSYQELDPPPSSVSAELLEARISLVDLYLLSFPPGA